MSLLANSNAIETGGYQISRSVRIRASASAYFNRTPASAGNRKTWTWSGWVKRGSFKYCLLFAAGNTNDIWNSSSTTQIGWNANTDSIGVYDSGTFFRTTTQVFRDPSAWYHLVVAIDTTQATPANRVKLYVNGSEVSAFATSNNPTLNADTFVNATHNHVIGGQQTNVANSYYDGYLTEINFIDGQALTPSSFGETDTITGSWVAKKYTGTYGTNGFYLNFSDNSAATATTIGKDYSGNGNNWTPNNISVTAGSTYDSMLDVPSGNGYADGGNGRGNYCVLNPLDKSSNATVTDGNLKIRTAVTGANNFAKGTMALPSDKIYFEATAGNNTGGTLVAELGLVDVTTQTYAGVKNGVQCTNGDFLKIVNGTYTSLGGGGVTSGTVIGLAYDLINGLMTIYRNGTAVSSNNSIPTTYTSVLAHAYRDVANDVGWELNFGQRPFSYTPPTNFKALNTTNLPDSTIKKGGSYFNAVPYSGTSGTRTVSGAGFQPDLVWLKDRTSTAGHALHDSVRGSAYRLNSSSTNAESDESASFTGFNSDGFALAGSDTAYNNSARTYATWMWKANGTGVTNTAGTITSTVSANTTSGFSIATTTGTGGTGTIGHGLGAVPQFIMCFRRNTAADHYCYHQAIGNTNFLILNSTAASAASANLWNNTTPTSTVFSVGNTNNNSGDTYVHYIFAPISGYSAFGSYTGNGSSTDGHMVFLGFRPKFVFWKNASTTGDWQMKDAARSTYNVTNANLYANLSNAENSAGDVDFLSNGFKIRSAGTDVNGSTNTIIYAAFAESPFKFSNAR